MTIIRNETELARHDRMVADANRNYPTIVRKAKAEHRRLLAEWRAAPQADRDAFNSLFGSPPTASAN